MELEYQPEHILLTIRDRGRGFAPKDVPLPSPHEAGGWGLWLVENLAERVEFEPAEEGGTAVRAWLFNWISTKEITS